MCDWIEALVLDPGLEGIVLKLSKPLVGVTGVTGLAGWLDDGSVLSSLVRFFLRNPKVGICYEIGGRGVRTLEEVAGSRASLLMARAGISVSMSRNTGTFVKESDGEASVVAYSVPHRRAGRESAFYRREVILRLTRFQV